MRTVRLAPLALVLPLALIVAACRPSTSPTSSTPVNTSTDVTIGSAPQVLAESTSTPTSTPTSAKELPVISGMPIATIETNYGTITLELFAADSPKTVENFITLAKQGFYANTKFHRVIPDFMIQGGDPLSKEAERSRWGTGGPGYQFADEFNSHRLVRGSLAMANAGANTNGSQFFIVTAESTPWLDGKHTNFGRVISGMDVIDQISAVATGERDIPVKDVVITKITISE